MTYIPGISQAYTTAEQTAATATDEKGKTLGQEDFLTLLVAQLQNQDPLNPSDPTEFTAQLANYSQLEQLFNLNSSMDKLAESQNNSERISALSMIGKEVLVEGSTFMLGEGTAKIGYKVDGSAADVQIHIEDENGTQVATLHPTDLSSGNHFITWQGMDENGEHLPPGKYRIVIEAQSSGEDETVGVSPLVRSEVTGVDLNEGGVVLLTDAGEYSFSNVFGVYDKQQEETEPEDGEQPTEEQTESEGVSAATDGAEIVEEADTVVETVENVAESVTGG